MRLDDSGSNITTHTGRGGCRAAIIALACAICLAGCAATPAAKEQLAQAYKELENPTPNYAAMMQASDAYLAEQPAGPNAAEALYLRGRALEEKARRDQSSPTRDLAAAHAAYSQALAKNPRPSLEGLIRGQLGNVLYFQEKYALAIPELAAAFEKLERPDDKAWALYRMGLCQQRVGQWSQADQTFTRVNTEFPSTEQAKRARDHFGFTAFWVQVGTYSSPATADAAVADLKKQGWTATKFADPTRNAPQKVRIGPMPTHDAAAAMKQRVLSKYRDAMIVP